MVTDAQHAAILAEIEVRPTMQIDVGIKIARKPLCVQPADELGIPVSEVLPGRAPIVWVFGMTDLNTESAGETTV